MNTPEEVLDRISNRRGSDTFTDLIKEGFVGAIESVVVEAMKEYASEYAKEALKNASEGYRPTKIIYNSTTKNYDEVVSKKSVLSEDNLPKH